MMDTPLLQVKNLCTTFEVGAGEVRAVNGVSFNLDRGKVLGIVGESGSGKSVTAYSIMRILVEPGKIVGGEVLFKGDNIVNYSEKQMREFRGKRVSIVFQDPMTSLNPTFTIGNQLREAILLHTDRNRAQANARALEMLQLVGVNEPEKRLKQYPHELSGGMRQRVMIAMALSCKPKLLIADEPTTALDVTIQLQIMQLLQKLRDETGMAILLITHDLGVVSEIADRVVVMYAGQCVESADVRTLLENPAHPYTRALMQAIPSVHDKRDKRLYAIPGTVPEHYEKLTGCRFAPRCPYGEACPCEPLQERPLEGDKHWVRCCRGAEKAGARHA